MDESMTAVSEASSASPSQQIKEPQYNQNQPRRHKRVALACQRCKHRKQRVRADSCLERSNRREVSVGNQDSELTCDGFCSAMVLSLRAQPVEDSMRNVSTSPRRTTNHGPPRLISPRLRIASPSLRCRSPIEGTLTLAKITGPNRSMVMVVTMLIRCSALYATSP